MFWTKRPLVANGIHHTSKTNEKYTVTNEHVHLPAGEMIGNIEFNKVWSIESFLHDIQNYVFLHITPNLTTRFFINNTFFSASVLFNFFRN